jgi:CRISPR/Cas system-associated exonuclease Cas4 (RecB family)
VEIDMGTEKLLDKLANLLDAGRRKQVEKHEKLKKLLKKLKKRQEKHKKLLEAKMDPEGRKRIERTLKVIYTQRQKGIKLYKDISHELKQKNKI